MVDACYLCRRTQADLDRLNEEVRTRVYLSYFSNTRAQIDELQRKISFLQRLKDEESGDPHFRIGAAQVFGDPPAYKKLMPWIETLMEIANSGGQRAEVRGTIGELVLTLLERERTHALAMEEALNQVRGGFATGGRSPLALHPMSRSFPVEWTVGASGLLWHPSQASDLEPLERHPDQEKPAVVVPFFLCSICQRLTGAGERSVAP